MVRDGQFLALLTFDFTPQRPALFRHLNLLRRCGVFWYFDFKTCFSPQSHALFRHLNPQKWSERVVFFGILTSKHASGHSGMHFFNISTSKSAPRMECFGHFDFKMCFAPQQRARFLNISTSKSAPRMVCSVRFDIDMCFAPQRRALL